MENLRLLGKVAIITGSSSGIGASAAKLMARRGAKVTIHGRSQARLDAVKADIIEAGVSADDIHSVTGDVTDPIVRQNLADETFNKFGGIDILVNNAGVGQNQTLLKISQAELSTAMNLLLFSPILLSQLCHPHLAKNKGTIINISSCVTETVVPGSFAYAVAKLGLDCYSKHAAVEFGKDGIRVNSIKPGVVETPIWQGNNLEGQDAGETLFLDLSRKISLLGFNAESIDIAEIIAFYASPAARFITADCNVCDGGMTTTNAMTWAMKYEAQIAADAEAK